MEITGVELYYILRDPESRALLAEFMRDRIKVVYNPQTKKLERV